MAYESFYSKKDPYISFRFKVEIDDIIVGAFSEVSGLSVETGVKVFTEGGVNDFEYKIPERTKQTNLVLKKGMTDSDALWKWYLDIINGKKKSRKSGAIIILEQNGLPEIRWNFVEAFPIKWEGPALNANTTNAVAIESITIVHQGLKRQ